MPFNGYLAYVQNTDTSQEIRNGTRVSVVVTLPKFPLTYDSFLGQQLYLAFNNTGILSSMRGSYSLDGLGAGVFTLTSANDTPLDDMFGGDTMNF